jgi:hypothetical protein
LLDSLIVYAVSLARLSDNSGREQLVASLELVEYLLGQRRVEVIGHLEEATVSPDHSPTGVGFCHAFSVPHGKVSSQTLPAPGPFSRRNPSQL